MAYKASKNGNGAFTLRVEDDGSTFTSVYDAGEVKFLTPQEAYDWHRARFDEMGGMHGNSHWNVCYHLEDVIDGNVLPVET